MQDKNSTPSERRRNDADLPDEALVKQLRVLRDFATRLNATVRGDLEPFLQEDKLTFCRRPRSKRTEVNPTTTCTVQMALAGNDLLTELYPDKQTGDSINDIFRPIVDARWTSSGLHKSNPFTRILVFRNAGFLASAANGSAPSLLGLKKKSKTLRELILNMTKRKIPDCFKLDETLRENPALGYWLVDAIDRLCLPLEPGLPESFWTEIAAWSSREFARQHSLLSSRQDIMMDPVALAMAACLCERLRAIGNQRQFQFGDQVKSLLPTPAELLHGLSLLLALQQPSGIWDKFFPMFYYREEGKQKKEPNRVHRGGANYCFAFEFLEAILNEFGKLVVRNLAWLQGLNKACSWCEENRLSYHFKAAEYCGWNSGQQVDSLALGEPESWATGVVHMFLRRLRQVLSEAIQGQLLQRYRATSPKDIRPVDSPKAWDNYLDCALPLDDTSGNSTKKLIAQEIFEPFESTQTVDGGNEAWKPTVGGQTHVELSQRRSALLFGPPGTSKTKLVEAIAQRLCLPYLEITPSDFLRRGLEQIYVRANEIFEDLMDLSEVVILFDEMDALVQRREGHGGVERIDVTRQFLTTSMLPKLAKLHKNARVFFFMATNHQSEFDTAIKRPGRFDLLVQMGPPIWEEKLRGLKAWLKRETDEDVEWTRKTLNTWGAAHVELKEMLEWFTFGEMNELFDYLRRQNQPEEKLRAELEKRDYDGFRGVVKDWFENTITLRKSSSAYQEFIADKDAVRVQ